MLDQFLRVRLAQDSITLDFRSYDLSKNIFVGESSNKSVLGSAVLVLILSYQLVSLAIVGFTLSSPSELNLIPLEVGLVLYNFNECLDR